MFVETFEEFKERMKCEYFEVKGRFLFANGAQSTGSFSHSDPPTEEFARLGLIREFLKAKQDKYESEFNDLKEHVLEQASLHSRYSNLPAPSPDAPDALRRLQNVVLKTREQLKAIEERIEQRPDKRFISVQDQLRNEQKAKAHQILSEVQKIEI